MKQKAVLIVFFLFTFYCRSYCQEPMIKESKSKYSVFFPTPEKKMRGMETDRPDITESSYTVDAGHFQYESDLLRYSISEEGNIRNNKLVINNGNYKIGLTNTMDFHIVFETYIINTEKNNTDNTSNKTKDVGDIVLRCKKNIIGNDYGNVSIAVLPYIKLPTIQYYKNIYTEGGVIIPYTFSIIPKWSIGGEVQLQVLKQTNKLGYNTLYMQSFVTEHEVNKLVSFFLETHFTYSGELMRFENYANGGLIFEVNEHFHIDCGINYGIQSYASKSYFIGMSYRK